MIVESVPLLRCMDGICRTGRAGEAVYSRKNEAGRGHDCGVRSAFWVFVYIAGHTLSGMALNFLSMPLTTASASTNVSVSAMGWAT